VRSGSQFRIQSVICSAIDREKSGQSSSHSEGFLVRARLQSMARLRWFLHHLAASPDNQGKFEGAILVSDVLRGTTHGAFGTHDERRSFR